MTWVKICGITNLGDALEACRLGADAIGFVFADSPRRIEPEDAREIAGKLPPFVEGVGLWVDEDEKKVLDTALRCRIKTLQFHGQESPDYCQKFRGFRTIKAFRIKNEDSLEELKKYKVDGYLLDTWVSDKSGGTGESFDWKLAARAKKSAEPVILSGGIKPSNVVEALEVVRPYGVDVSSGVEVKPGKKDPALIEELIRKVREFDLKNEAK